MNEIPPICDFVQNASAHTARIRQTKRAEILTQHDRTRLAVMAAEEFERLIAAAETLDGIESVRSLEIAPNRHALARESAAFPVEIRCLLSGKNRSAFRILYQIKGDEVRVLAIRRPSQDLMDPEDESEPPP